MSCFTGVKLRKVLKFCGIFDGKGSRIPVCIETGTWKGTSTLIMSHHFEKVCTIEKEEKWFEFAKDRLSADRPNIEFLLGDSCYWLPILSDRFQHPCFWYLDAHWFSEANDGDQEETPLWKELEVLSRRKFSDVVVVDDVHVFGRKNSLVWKDVTTERILSTMNTSKAVSGYRRIHDMLVVSFND